MLVLDYFKRNYCKTFYSSAKLIARDSDIDEPLSNMVFYSQNKSFFIQNYLLSPFLNAIFTSI